MSKTTTAYIKDLGVIHDPPRSNALTRLKRHIREVQVKWGPLMAAKEDVFDEYNFPPGRYAGQGCIEKPENGEYWRRLFTISMKFT
jgi:hypothetical protein